MSDQITNFIQSITRRFRMSGGGGETLRPKRDWYLLLGSACVCTVVGAGVGFFEYRHTRAVVVNSAEAQPSSQVANEFALASVLSHYRTRTQTFETLRTSPPKTNTPGSDEGVVPLQDVTPVATSSATSTPLTEEEVTIPDGQ